MIQRSKFLALVSISERDGSQKPHQLERFVKAEETVVTVEMQLLERAAERDPRPFAELYDHYVDRIYKYFFYTTRTTGDAEELTAQVLSRARDGIEKDRRQAEPLASWLYRLAHRKLIDYRRVQNRTRLPANALLFANGEVLSDTAEGVCTSTHIHAAMQHLTLVQQEVTVLRLLEGHNATQVASIMNIGPDAVRVIQQEALQALEPWLGQETSRE